MPRSTGGTPVRSRYFTWCSRIVDDSGTAAAIFSARTNPKNPSRAPSVQSQSSCNSCTANPSAAARPATLRHASPATAGSWGGVRCLNTSALM
ncbi:MAG TPA: hypothetical protein VF469_16310 [Kofleriaceae bacterium]